MVVGITGGIGSGKSTVASIIRILGFPVYNSDIRSHELVKKSRKVIWSIKACFGDDVYEDGELNRKKLAEIVFNDKSKLEKLNRIIHPAVVDDFIAWKQAQQSTLVFKEAAILFESGAHRMMDCVIVVVAPEPLRIKRVMNRDGIGEALVKSRIANQWTDEEKLALADYTIVADDKQLLIPQVLNVIEKLKKE